MPQQVQIQEDRVEICISIGEGVNTGAANCEKQLNDLFEWFYEETHGVLQRLAKQDKQACALVLAAHLGIRKSMCFDATDDVLDPHACPAIVVTLTAAGVKMPFFERIDVSVWI